MSKIWFCRTCGYEVPARGRCHSCKARLERSPLPELPGGDEDDEVGYRIEGWTNRARGTLIVGLIDANIAHRFEEEDLVVAADDEERTDDLIAGIATDAPDVDEADDEDPAAAAQDEADEVLTADVELLYRAAARLRTDPTDMHADGDVAQASAVVFAADGFYGADEDTWAAVGRVTRRLLGALGADEALDDEIRLQAGVLVKLLQPLVGFDDAEVARPEAVTPAADDAEVARPEAVTPAADDAEVTRHARRGESVYELPQWLPEQRAQLGVLLDDAGIDHTWDGDDLVVPNDAEAAVEALFDRVEGVRSDDEDGDRYQALEELFAAADRFINDPDSKSKANDVVRAVAAADGPTPLGLDDAQWWSIRTRAVNLADAIEHDEDLGVVFDEATTLRDLLRALV
jgi:hypothetical protein